MSDTTSTTDLEARAAVTAGLRALAEFLDAHPTLPVPRFSISAGLTVYPGGSRGGQARRGRPHRRRPPGQSPTSSRSTRRNGDSAARSPTAPSRSPNRRTSPTDPGRRDHADILLVTLLAVVFITGPDVLALLVLVLVGIRTEERHMSLTSGPRTCAGSLARRLTGTSVRRPQQTPHCRYEDTRR